MMTINKKRNLGLYIHLPFCQRKCSYCGFLSLENQTEVVIQQYLKNLELESELRFIQMKKQQDSDDVHPYEIDTIYIGGGTPSLVNGIDMITLLEGIQQSWAIAKNAEITMESNPNSLTSEHLKAYLKAGVNRLSIGVQSFNDRILVGIGRLHDSQTAIKAYYMAKDAGFTDINLDLIFGLPGQTLQEWKESLSIAVSLEPTHLSLYTLQIEEGTKLYDDYKSAKLPLIDDSNDRACYHYAIDFLRQHGYHQYEISNFAKDGYTCKHNIKYWSLGDYLGLGLNASSYVDGLRWRNLSVLESWTAQLQVGVLPMDTTTLQSDSLRDSMGIFVFTGLRRTEGISFSEFAQRFGIDFFQAYANTIRQLNRYRKQGWLDWSETKAGRLWITETGIDYSNEIMAEFV